MKVKQKPHMIKQGDPIPSFTCHKILNNHQQVLELLSNPHSRDSLGPIWVLMCIHEEDVAVYGSDRFVLEPSLTTPWEPSGNNYGILCDFNCYIPNFRSLAIESLGECQGYIGIIPLQFLTEY